jgi:hypothetical protein
MLGFGENNKEIEKQKQNGEVKDLDAINILMEQGNGI